jgi:hypothetical protein
MVGFFRGLAGRFRSRVQSRSLVIGAAPAVAGVVPGGRIGRGREAIGPAVAHPAVHTRPGFPAPVVLSFVTQAHSWEN